MILEPAVQPRMNTDEHGWKKLSRASAHHPAIAAARSNCHPWSSVVIRGFSIPPTDFSQTPPSFACPHSLVTIQRELGRSPTPSFRLPLLPPREERAGERRAVARAQRLTKTSLCPSRLCGPIFPAEIFHHRDAMNTENRIPKFHPQIFVQKTLSPVPIPLPQIPLPPPIPLRPDA